MNITASRFSRTLLVVGIVLALAPARLLACATCYGESDAPMAKGAALAIVTLGAIIACVLVGVIAFFVHVRRKTAAQAELNPGAGAAQCNI